MQKRFSGYIVGGLLILLGIVVITTYNGLVRKEEKVNLTWNEVQNAYQRRLDLVPNLVNVVRGGADYEQETLQKVTEARARTTGVNPADAAGVNASVQAQNEMATAVNRLLVNVENYPDLKGTKAFADLQVQLEGTERRIRFARKDFNAAIQDYNSSVRAFPANMIGGMFGFKPREGFEAAAGADKAVEIKFQ